MSSTRQKFITLCFLLYCIFPAYSMEIKAMLLASIFNQHYVCNEHFYGQFTGPGDALGVDCFILQLKEKDGRKFPRPYAKDGLVNEDWFGWKQPVLAPISGLIISININSITNSPGILGDGIATYVMVRGEGGRHVVLAHLRELRVKEGDTVEEGEVIGLVGNNGKSRLPHVHLGAWVGSEPYQVRFD